MQARQKPLEVFSPDQVESLTQDLNFEKPSEKGPVRLVDAENIDELIDLLENEAKVI